MQVKFGGSFEVVPRLKNSSLQPPDSHMVLGELLPKLIDPKKPAPFSIFHVFDPAQGRVRTGILRSDKYGNHLGQYAQEVKDFYDQNPDIELRRQYEPGVSDFGDRFPVLEPAEEDFYQQLNLKYLNGDPASADKKLQDPAEPIHVDCRYGKLGELVVETIHFASKWLNGLF